MHKLCQISFIPLNDCSLHDFIIHKLCLVPFIPLNGTWYHLCITKSRRLWDPSFSYVYLFAYTFRRQLLREQTRICFCSWNISLRDKMRFWVRRYGEFHNWKRFVLYFSGIGHQVLPEHIITHYNSTMNNVSDVWSEIYLILKTVWNA